jgi:HSP20 family protein
MRINTKNTNSNFSPVRSFFDDFLRFPSMWDNFLDMGTGRATSADIWEDDNNVYVKTAVPGLRKENLNITIDNTSLHISGETTDTTEEGEKDKRYYMQRMSSRIDQRFALPSNVESTNAEAKLEDGILTITMPKSESSKPRQISIS